MARCLRRRPFAAQPARSAEMKHKGNGKTPPRKPRKPNGGPRQGAGDDPGFTATRASSSRTDDAKGRDGESEDVEDRESGLKQAGVSDLGGTGPRKKTGRDH